MVCSMSALSDKFSIRYGCDHAILLTSKENTVALKYRKYGHKLISDGGVPHVIEWERRPLNVAFKLAIKPLAPLNLAVVSRFDF